MRFHLSPPAEPAATPGQRRDLQRLSAGVGVMGEHAADIHRALAHHITYYDAALKIIELEHVTADARARMRARRWAAPVEPPAVATPSQREGRETWLQSYRTWPRDPKGRFQKLATARQILHIQDLIRSPRISITRASHVRQALTRFVTRGDIGREIRLLRAIVDVGRP